MKKGGYKIVNLKGIELSSTAVVFDGLYDSLENNNKATLVSGLCYADVEYDDFFATFTVSSTDFVATINDLGIAITVSDDDEVTVADLT